MLLDLKGLIDKYNMNIKGILHIGAYLGEELKIYQQLGIKDALLFEPQYNIYEALKYNADNYNTFYKTNYYCLQIALGNHDGWVDLHVSKTGNNPEGINGSGGSSSILKPKLHLKQHTNITFPFKTKVPITTLDRVMQDTSKFNMINIDVQGYELRVLEGALNTLKHIDYIMIEVNRDETYEDCVLVDQLDEFLAPDFKRVETNWAGNIWGDALYIR